MILITLDTRDARQTCHVNSTISYTSYLRLMIFLYGQLLAIGRATIVSVCGSSNSFKVHRSCINVVLRARRARVALTKNPYRPLTAFMRPVLVSRRDSRLLNAFMYNWRRLLSFAFWKMIQCTDSTTAYEIKGLFEKNNTRHPKEVFHTYFRCFHVVSCYVDLLNGVKYYYGKTLYIITV